MHVTSGKRSIRLWSAVYLKSHRNVHIFLTDTRPMSSKVETLTIKPNIMITYCLTVFPLTLKLNTWLWLTLNPDFVLYCVLRQHVWSSEAWPLSKLGYSLSYTCSKCCWRTSTEKNTCGIARFPCGSTAFLFTGAFTWYGRTGISFLHPMMRPRGLVEELVHDEA